MSMCILDGRLDVNLLGIGEEFVKSKFANYPRDVLDGAPIFRVGSFKMLQFLSLFGMTYCVGSDDSQVWSGA